jgi:hypothetical protein
VWALSPALTGHREPWDTTRHYYTLGLIVAGQLLYALTFLESGPLWLVGLVFMWIYGFGISRGSAVGWLLAKEGYSW